MTSKIIAALALSLALGTGALAQTGTGSNGTAGGATGDSASALLTGPMADAFYSDSAGTLRSRDEMRTNFGNLSSDQQAQLRTGCAEMANSQSESGTDNMQTSSTNTGASNFATTPGMPEICDSLSDL